LLIHQVPRTLPPGVRQRYTDEWLAELDASPGNLSKLAVAVRIFVRAPATSVAISGLPSIKAMAVKALFDKLVAAWTLVVMAPMLTAIAQTIKITDGGPVFVRQTRIGKDGEPFRVWRFRTTTVAGTGGRKLQLTKAGTWLRRYSLDELPQLFNLLLGDMSLVGPRPVLPVEVAKYRDRARCRLAVRPGFTGLWQISGRSDLSWNQAARLDQRYVDDWSLALDLQIPWRTWATIIRGRAPAPRRPSWRPDWWDFPLECAHGHPWMPDSVRVSWSMCECPAAVAACSDRPPGHLAVYCCHPLCESVWYRPWHESGNTQAS
jgi:lipopolysaccharide/colanic/teichoic acid biosynthesis glycosyltransferase